MGKTTNQHSTPNPKREKKKPSPNRNSNNKMSARDNSELVRESMAARIEKALQIITTIDENTNRFMRNWMGINHLYNANAFSGNERDRLMSCIEDGITNEQASDILAAVHDELSYYALTPPGDMRLPSTHPEFRTRARRDLHNALDESLSASRRLAYLMCAVYQVRCNLIHGEKAPRIRRNQELLEKGSKIIETVTQSLVASMRH